MFNLSKKSDRDELVISNRDNFIQILDKLLRIVEEKNFSHQNKTIKDLIALLKLQRTDDFIKLLNSVEVWGGSGAVWEIHIENKNTAYNFELEMINLIDLMEKTKVLGKGIKPIRKIFKENMKTNTWS